MSSDEVIANQKMILENQRTILANKAKLEQLLENQVTIQGNQQKILANQGKLDQVLENQITIQGNQQKIQSNQGKLDHILANQKTIEANQDKILANQEKLLAFFLFDLTSCIEQKETPKCPELTCADYPQGTCGQQSNGCGGLTPNCGVCTPPATCGGAGTPSRCGVGSTCTRKTCQAGQCGDIPDGCGGLLQCGNCTNPGDTCGGAGTRAQASRKVASAGWRSTSRRPSQPPAKAHSMPETTPTGTIHALKRYGKSNTNCDSPQPTAIAPSNRRLRPSTSTHDAIRRRRRWRRDAMGAGKRSACGCISHDFEIANRKFAICIDHFAICNPSLTTVSNASARPTRRPAVPPPAAAAGSCPTAGPVCPGR